MIESISCMIVSNGFVLVVSSDCCVVICHFQFIYYAYQDAMSFSPSATFRFQRDAGPAIEVDNLVALRQTWTVMRCSQCMALLCFANNIFSTAIPQVAIVSALRTCGQCKRF